MTQLLFGLTVIFVGYVIYEVFKTVSESHGTAPPAMESAPRPAEDASSISAAIPAGESAPSVSAATPVSEPASSAVADESAASAPAPASAEQPAPAEPASQEGAEHSTHLRNPLNGEVAPVPTNYRFAKKWIKEALVAEGLLDRVYKPNELDDTVAQKVKDALEKFRHLDKYRA